MATSLVPSPSKKITIKEKTKQLKELKTKPDQAAVEYIFIIVLWNNKYVLGEKKSSLSMNLKVAVMLHYYNFCVCIIFHSLCGFVSDEYDC